MGQSKLAPLHIYLIGGVIALIVAVGMYFARLKPLGEKVTAKQQEVTGVEGTSTSVNGTNVPYNGEAKAKEILQAAVKSRDTKKAELVSLEARRQFPPGQTIDLGKTGDDTTIMNNGTMAKWLGLPRRVVEVMERYSESRARRRGVQVTTNFTAAPPATTPASIPRDVIAWNLGTMTITGEYPKVMQWVKDWNSAPLLVAVDGLKCTLEGRNGRIKADASLVVYIFPTGEAVQTSSAGAATATTGGGMGGGGGMMGGPSGGMMSGPPGGSSAPPGGMSGPPGAAGPGTK
jgi:hypothetical protein